MALQIGTNPSSLSAQRSLISSQSDLKTSFQRLSSGSRINTAQDDAAGLAIGNRLQGQAAGLAVAQRNAANGISLAETRDAALSTMSDLLIRAQELGVQYADGTLNSDDKGAIRKELEAIDTQLTAIQSASFAGIGLFSSTVTSATVGVGLNGATGVAISTAEVTTTIPFAAGTSSSPLEAGDITGAVTTALKNINDARADMGAAATALQGQLENMAAVEQGVTTAAGRIMDTDFARESAMLAKNQILQQAGTAVLAQANQSTQSVLSLLQ